MGNETEREAFEAAMGSALIAEQGKFALSRAYEEGHPYTFLATKWAWAAWAVGEVKRYTVPGRYLVDNGKNLGAQDVVLATDYATLEAENAKLRAELEWRESGEWKLVPVEPTEQMANAYWDAYQKANDTHFMHCYRAMLAAAPSAPKADPVKVQLLEALTLAANRIDRLRLEVSQLNFANEVADWTDEARAAIAAARQEGGKA